MVTEDIGQNFTASPQNDENKRLRRVLDRLTSLRNSWLARHWRITLLPALLILAVLVVFNWRLRSRLGPEEPFSTFTLPYEQTFDDVQINRWFSSGGKWIVQGGALLPKDQGTEPAKVFVPKWLPEGESYHLAVEMTLEEGVQAAGINFNAQYPEIHRDHQRISVTSNGDQLELQAGMVNEVDGFQAETTVPLASPAETLKLDLLVEQDAYDVLVNGEMLIQQRPLTYSDGLVGLFTIAGSAKFDNLILNTFDESFQVEELSIQEETAGADEDTVADEGAVADEVVDAEPVTEPAVAAVPVPVSADAAYTSNFAEGLVDGWAPIAGEWRIENGRYTQYDATGFDFASGYTEQAFQNYTFQATLTHLTGRGGGLLFNMASPNQIRDAHLVRYSDRSDAIMYGYIDSDGAFNSQGFSNVSTAGAEAHTLKVVSGESSYDLYLDEQKIASAIPLNRKSGHIGLVTAKSSVAYGLIDVSDALEISSESVVGEVEQPSPAEPVPTAEPVVTLEGISGSIQVADAPATTNVSSGSIVSYDTDSVDANSRLLTAGLDGWVNISGQWSEEDGNLVQSEVNGFDLAVGYADSTFSAVDLQTTITHLDGTGAGILFNMPAANSLNGAHMVRFADWADALIWGYYDEAGQFKGQGYAKIESPNAGPNTIRVNSGADTYSVYLDGQQLISELPLFSRDGYIGLITTRSAAAFGPIQIGAGGQSVSAVAGPEQAAVVSDKPGDIFGDIETISGEWVREGTKLSQLNSATYDFSLSTGVYAGVYTLETGITLPEDPDLLDAGGGILFHMPERDSRNGAHMVRLAGQDELIWGYYDQTGAFVGQGRADLEPTDLVTHALQVVAGDEVYRIKVDGQEIAQDVPLKQQEGWIGLVSYRGPVAFDNISVTFGTAE